MIIICKQCLRFSLQNQIEEPYTRRTLTEDTVDVEA